MNGFEKAVKACAIGLAVIIIFSIFSGIAFGFSILAHIVSGSDSTHIKTNYDEEFVDITSLKLDLISANLTITEGDTFRVEASTEDDRIEIKEKNGILELEEKKKWGWNIDYNTIKITIPAKTILKELKIDSGAGKIEMDSINAYKLDLEEGAGVINIENSEFQTTKISGGAGRTEIKNSTLNDLDLDTGAGEVVIKSKITGRSTIECGVGRVEVRIPNKKEEYQIQLEKGLGSILVDGEKVSGDTIIGNGQNRLKIEGGIGSIELSFEE